MASQSQPVTTTDVPNYVGELLFLGQKFGRSPLLSLAGLGTASSGGLTAGGYDIVTGSYFAMGNVIEGDAPAQDGQTEDASIAAMTDTSYTGAQATNYTQIFRKTWVVSYASEAQTGTISGVAINGAPQAIVSAAVVQREAHLKQMAADYEYSALYGTGAAWTNATTTGAMGGLFTAVEAGSETAAAGVPLSTTLIDTEIARMAAAGAEFIDPVISVAAFQRQQLNRLYGNAIQSQTIGGTNVTSLLLPVIGNCRVIDNPIMAADDFGIVDLNHFRLVFALKPGMPPIFIEPLAKIAAGDREQLFSIASINYGNIAYHGMISGLATS